MSQPDLLASSYNDTEINVSKCQNDSIDYIKEKEHQLTWATGKGFPTKPFIVAVPLSAMARWNSPVDNGERSLNTNR